MLFFDKGLYVVIKDIVVCGGAFFGDIQRRIASLPMRFGGLGLYSAIKAPSYAFIPLRSQSWVLQDHNLWDSGICSMNSEYACPLASPRKKLSDINLSSFTTSIPPLNPRIH